MLQGLSFSQGEGGDIPEEESLCISLTDVGETDNS